MHFTGDLAAAAKAANLLAALIDNHLHHSNSLNLDGRRISWKRVVDLNDRALRDIIIVSAARSTASPARMASSSPPLRR